MSYVPAIRVEHPNVAMKAAAARAFPSWRGRKYRVQPCESMQLSGTQWSGGSKSEYVVVDFRTGVALPVSEHPFLRASELHDVPYAMVQGIVVLEHSWFCGKDAGVTFHVHPADLPKMLPAGETKTAALAEPKRLEVLDGEEV